jgi:hypothetical protein
MNSITTELIKKSDVKDTVNRLFIGTDNRDWPAVLECFAEHVHFDVSSMTGEAPKEMTAKDIVAGWDEGLKHLEAIHHQAGNFLIDIDQSEAKVYCYGTAWHYLPNQSGRNTRAFVGSYDFGLFYWRGRWKINAFKFNLKFIDGNPDLENS